MTNQFLFPHNPFIRDDLIHWCTHNDISDYQLDFYTEKVPHFNSVSESTNWALSKAVGTSMPERSADWLQWLTISFTNDTDTEAFKASHTTKDADPAEIATWTKLVFRDDVNAILENTKDGVEIPSVNGFDYIKWVVAEMFPGIEINDWRGGRLFRFKGDDRYLRFNTSQRGDQRFGSAVVNQIVDAKEVWANL